MVLNNGATYLPTAGEGPVDQWFGVYAGTVVNNHDPLGVGRLQLNVPQVLGNSVSTWAVPAGTYYAIPTNGTPVSVTFLGGDPAQPLWSGPLDLNPLVQSAAGPNVTYSSSAPANPKVGDIWYETLGGLQAPPQVWTFNAISSTYSWVTQPSLAGNAVGTGVLTANNIQANSLTGTVMGSLGACLNVNPFFSGGSITGWFNQGTGSSSTVVTGGSIPTGSPYPGGYAGELIVVNGVSKLSGGNDKFGVVVGRSYCAAAWVLSTNAITVNFDFEFRNSSSTIVGTLGTSYALAANTWTLVSTVQIAPATSATGNLAFYPQAATTIYVQAAQAFPQIQGIVDATTITGSTINGAVFNGTNWIENGDGAFFYSGAPKTATLNHAATGGTVLAGTYQVQVTYENSSGEGLPSFPASVTTTGSTSTITITSPVAQGNATNWYAYVTQAGGTTFTRQQASGSPTAIGTNLTLTAPPTNTGANPPTTPGTGINTPGNGNLAASIAPKSGTDQYGNAYQGGMFLYEVGGNAMGGLMWNTYSGSQPLVALYPDSSFGFTGDAPYILAEVANKGLSSEWVALDLGSGNPPSPHQNYKSLVRVFSGSPDGTTSIAHTSIYGGNPSILICDINPSGIVAANPVTTNVNETWHNVSPSITNWTFTVCRYMLKVDNTVHIQITATNTAAAAAGTVNLFTLPSQYFPATAYSGCAPGTFGGLGNTRFKVSTAGAVSFVGWPGGAAGITETEGYWVVPLD